MESETLGMPSSSVSKRISPSGLISLLDGSNSIIAVAPTGILENLPDVIMFGYGLKFGTSAKPTRPTADIKRTSITAFSPEQCAGSPNVVANPGMVWARTPLLVDSGLPVLFLHQYTVATHRCVHRNFYRNSLSMSEPRLSFK